MKTARYIPPDVGGSVELRISAELARLIKGMLGTISANDLSGLFAAGNVREEISTVHSDLSLIFGNDDDWQSRGRKLRLSP